MRKLRRSMVSVLLALLGLIGASIPVLADGIPPFP